MKTEKILEGSSIVLGVFVIFLVQNTQLSNYSAYLLAILIIFSAIYISIKRRSTSSTQLFSGNPPELFFMTSIIVLIVSLTNGYDSPLFFFLYFMLFLLAFMSEAVTVLIFLVAIILFFIPQASSNFSLDAIVKLSSLILISPIAYFIGREFERRTTLNRRIEDKTSEIIQEAEILKEEGSEKTSEEIEAIEEIIEEAETLKKDSEE